MFSTFKIKKYLNFFYSFFSLATMIATLSPVLKSKHRKYAKSPFSSHVCSAWDAASNCAVCAVQWHFQFFAAHTQKCPPFRMVSTSPSSQSMRFWKNGDETNHLIICVLWVEIFFSLIIFTLWRSYLVNFLFPLVLKASLGLDQLTSEFALMVSCNGGFDRFPLNGCLFQDC